MSYMKDSEIDKLASEIRELDAERKKEGEATNDQPQTEAKKKARQTAFIKDGDWLIELIKNDAGPSFVLFNIVSGELVEHAQVRLEDGTLLTPPEPNLIDKNIVLLPSGVEDYENETDLFKEIKTFINYYVELGDFSLIASLYVLLTWVYDRFNELPYLRFMGDYGTGKTRALTVVGHVCYKSFFTFGASTVSPIFRLLDAFRGTLVLDEGDHKDSSMWNELIKILNTGFQANIPLLRTEGDRKREVKAYHVYSPKLIATRRPFFDDALESRCLTHIMRPGIRRVDIPINLPQRFYKEAESLRNKLLFFRLKNYSQTKLNETIYIDNLEDRLNQIFIPLLSIAKGKFQAQLIEFSQNLQEKILEARSQSFEGQAIQALLDLSGNEKITVKQVSEKLGTTPHNAGRIIRGLGIETKRSTNLKGTPYVVVLNKINLEALSKRYGIPF